MKDSVVTNAGAALVIESTAFKKIEFTKIALSSRKYAPEEIKNLTTLLDVRQTSLVNKVTTEGNTVIVESGFDNQELTQGYYIETIGVYGKVSGGKEVLFSVSIADEASYISKYNGITNSGVILSIATKLSNAENISLSVNPAAYATQGEVNQLTKQLAELDEQTDELDQKQKDLIAQLADYMTKEQFVRFLAGETIEVIGKCDFVGKVSGSVVENPHYFGRNGATTSLVLPTGLWPEASQSQYANLEKLDGKVAVLDGRQDAGYYAQNINKWNLIEQINRDHPNLFESLGANTLAKKIETVKRIWSSGEYLVAGRGSGPDGYKVTTTLYNRGWGSYRRENATNTIQSLKATIASDIFQTAIDDLGMLYVLAYAEPSDGTTPSIISIDTAQLAYSLKLSLYDFVPKKGDVYDKTQADQRFVSLSENQTVGGVKNFIERPTYDGTELLVPGEAQMIKVTADNGGMALSMDNSKTLLQWIADAGWGIRSCYMTANVVGGTGFSGRGLIVNNESATSMAGYILMNKTSSLEFNNGLMVRHFLPDTISGGIMWASDWIKCGSTNKTRLTPTTTGVAAGQTIELAKDVRNFTMLNVCTGGVSDGANIIQSISPYVDSTWRPAADGSMDRWGVLTANGARVILVLTSYTTLRVESTPAGAAGIRYIDGIM